jgi:ribosomal protein S18 acetylase RimI-like enzyme
MMGSINVRMMRETDIQSVAEIHNQVLSTRLRNYWTTRAGSANVHSAIPPFVAEIDQRIIGFVMGEASGGEYGLPCTVGWIDSIGVVPEFQRQNVARMLVEELVAYMRKVGVTKVYTLVKQNDGEMLPFFEKLGFKTGDLINLELKV